MDKYQRKEKMNNIANIATFGALTPQEKTYLDTLYAQREPLMHKAMGSKGLTPEESQRYDTIQAEIERLEKQNRTIFGKMRPYMRVLAMGIEYSRSKSIARALGASILPYPYMVYLAYSAYTSTKTKSNPRIKRTKRTKRK